jgi:hypothetical protein
MIDGFLSKVVAPGRLSRVSVHLPGIAIIRKPTVEVKATTFGFADNSSSGHARAQP